MNFASSDSKITIKSKNDNTADNTGNKFTYMTPITRPKTFSVKNEQNVELSLIHI